MVLVPYADEIAIYAPEYHQAHPGCTEAPMGRDVWIRSMSARFMNCSSASTRVVYICIGAQRSKLSATPRALKSQANDTHTQKPVEINAASVECAVEVIYCVLNRIILGDKIYKSVCDIYARDYGSPVALSAQDTY